MRARVVRGRDRRRWERGKEEGGEGRWRVGLRGDVGGGAEGKDRI